MLSHILNINLKYDWLGRCVDITALTLNCSGLLMIYGISDSVTRAVDT